MLAGGHADYLQEESQAHACRWVMQITLKREHSASWRVGCCAQDACSLEAGQQPGGGTDMQQLATQTSESRRLSAPQTRQHKEFTAGT